ncbi:MAG: hypothetical protein K9M99_08450 [Candidatus Cloacimonetes bacterium]|nr:hypothetical protein [Candidatus Cloacimonadota bacterium]
MNILKKSVILLLFFSLLFISGCWSYISKEAKEKFDTREGEFSVTVFPVSVVLGPERESDEELAVELIEFLSKESLAVPVMGTDAVNIPVKWGRNQAKMAQQSAIHFSEVMKGVEIQTDYALMVEILCNSGEDRVGGVHFFLCDKDGNLANGGLTNSHWEEFKEIEPHDRQGGLEVAKLMLRRIWLRPESKVSTQ